MTNGIKDNKMNWHVQSDDLIEDFGIFRTRRSVRINPRNGNPHTYFLMDGLNWANVIALTPQQEIVLVKQYRHGVDDYVIEIPGGCIEATDGDPCLSAKRELLEETGYSAESFLHIGTVQANPAMQSMTAMTFFAENAVKTGKQHLDLTEDIEVLVEPLEKVFRMIAEGTIQHSIVVAAFMFYKLKISP